MKFGSKLTWRLFPVAAEEDEALKQSRATTVRTTIRKYLRREQRRAQQDGLCTLRGHTGGKNGDFMSVESTATACVHRHPAGAMAPENTTQYLMGNLYDDMNIDINNSGTLMRPGKCFGNQDELRERGPAPSAARL